MRNRHDPRNVLNTLAFAKRRAARWDVGTRDALLKVQTKEKTMRTTTTYEALANTAAPNYTEALDRKSVV